MKPNSIAKPADPTGTFSKPTAILSVEVEFLCVPSDEMSRMCVCDVFFVFFFFLPSCAAMFGLCFFLYRCKKAGCFRSTYYYKKTACREPSACLPRTSSQGVIAGGHNSYHFTYFVVVCLHVCLSACLSACLSVCPSLCMYACMYVSI